LPRAWTGGFFDMLWGKEARKVLRGRIVTVGRAHAGLCLASAALALPGCAGPSSYAGISFDPGAADPVLQALARRAQAADKEAQLQLGIRFEEGLGVERSRRHARLLYAKAAADREQPTYSYHHRGPGQSLGFFAPAGASRREAGLEEAKRRLRRLNARGDSK
jgi:hypothetical protein